MLEDKLPWTAMHESWHQGGAVVSSFEMHRHRAVPRDKLRPCTACRFPLKGQAVRLHELHKWDIGTEIAFLTIVALSGGLSSSGM